jgi:gamma-glutamyl-gamma-aminobutyrate hydrolase PuuD
VRKPRIAITVGANTPEQSVARYLAAVERAGGDPVPIRPGDRPSLAEFDGLLLSGGGDINPARYGQEPDPHTTGIDDARDELEFSLAKAALIRDIPVLAICRGFQVLNVVCDGSLVQHVEGHALMDGGISRRELASRPRWERAAACSSILAITKLSVRRNGQKRWWWRP